MNESKPPRHVRNEAAPPAPVCEKCGHMEHPDGECCWPLRRGPAGYVHKHCNCGGKRTPTPAPDLSPCTDCPPSDTTHAKAEHAPDDEMRPEYDFREGERGKYFERYNAPPAPDYLDTGDCPECGHEAHKPDGCVVPADFCDCPKRHAPPAPVCQHARITEGRCEECGKNVMPHFNAPPAPERPSDEDFETWCREDRSLAIREARRARESEMNWKREANQAHLGDKVAFDAMARAEKAEAEVAALKGMIAYALEAPDAEATKTILTDALDGVTGADNVSDVRGERERLRAALARDPADLAREFHDIYEAFAPDFGYETRPETREFDPDSSNGRLMIAVCKEVMERIAREALEGK